MLFQHNLLNFRIEYHSKLHSKIWRSESQLCARARILMVQIVDLYMNFMAANLNCNFSVKENIRDICFFGSLANYDYTKSSDIDIGIYIDFSKTRFGEFNEDLKSWLILLSKDFKAKYGPELYGRAIDIMLHPSQELETTRQYRSRFSLIANKWPYPLVRFPDYKIIEITPKTNLLFRAFVKKYKFIKRRDLGIEEMLKLLKLSILYKNSEEMDLEGPKRYAYKRLRDRGILRKMSEYIRKKTMLN